MKSKILYLGGVLAGLIYLTGDIVGGVITPNYSYAANAASELIQTGAENRALLSAFFFLHGVAIITAGLAIVNTHSRKQAKRLHFVGILLIIVGTSHAFSGTIFAMDPVGSEPTVFGIMHLVLVGISVLAILVLFPLAGLDLKKRYGWHGLSIFTFVCFTIIFLSGISSPYVINNDLPYMGLTERITGYVFYVWLMVICLRLMKTQQ